MTRHDAVPATPVLATPITPDLAALCRDLAIRLTERPSVTGTLDEASFGPWLAGLLRSLGHWGEDVEAWTIPVAEGDARCVVAFLVRGQGREAVVLTGHYDTVTTADYGELAALAISPEALLPALMRRLANAATPAEARARADFAVEGWLPGRGLLDMKGGLAAGLAAMAAHAATPARRGNLLFLAVPDEEYASTGARAAALALPGLARERDLDVVAAINLDSISDDADGVAGRVVALGTVGKVLPTAFVVGEPVHSGFPLRGLNAAVLAGAIARALEWAPELTDESAAEAGTPVSLLSLRDGKVGYDVTTPATAWATWSVLNHRRDPSTVLRMVERLVREAADACLADLAQRASRSGQPVGILAWAEGVRVMRWSALLKELRARDPAIDAELAAEAGRLRDQNLDLPEACHRLTAWAWRRSGLAGPAVVLGLGSIPYLATELRSQRVRAAVEALAADAPARHGTSLAVVDYFAGISDMSFFGQGDVGAFGRLAADTPAWDVAVGVHAGHVAQVPTVNLGPWGRDYHTPLERMEADYAFRVLPRLLHDLCGRLLAS